MSRQYKLWVWKAVDREREQTAIPGAVSVLFFFLILHTMKMCRHLCERVFSQSFFNSYNETMDKLSGFWTHDEIWV